jgi:hypothetical protein
VNERSKIAFAIGFALLCRADAGEAQTFVSAIGNDANACTRAAPCRSLQRGIDATGAGRELTILDSGEYGRATITRSITVSAEDVAANIRAYAQSFPDGIAILIDNEAARVVLRGLLITGGGAGLHGIEISRAASVHIIGCEIERFIREAIYLHGDEPTELFVGDSIVRDNSSDGLYAHADLRFAEGPHRVTVADSRFENNGRGITVSGGRTDIVRSTLTGNGYGLWQVGSTMDVSDTVLANNDSIGFYLVNGQSADGVDHPSMHVRSSVIRGSETGIRLALSGVGRISGVTITQNGVGVSNDDTIYTLGDNLISGNGVDFEANPLTPIVAK